MTHLMKFCIDDIFPKSSVKFNPVLELFVELWSMVEAILIQQQTITNKVSNVIRTANSCLPNGTSLQLEHLITGLQASSPIITTCPSGSSIIGPVSAGYEVKSIVASLYSPVVPLLGLHSGQL